MLYKVTHCAGHVSANISPHQLHWGDREMGTAISCTERSQVYRSSLKAPSFHKQTYIHLSTDQMCQVITVYGSTSQLKSLLQCTENMAECQSEACLLFVTQNY